MVDLSFSFSFFLFYRVRYCISSHTPIFSHTINITNDQTLILDINPISERIKYKVTCMCFSAINGSGPAYLSELLHVYTPSHTQRSSSDTHMLEIQQYKRKTHGFCTFSCFGPHIRNSLPQDLRHCSTLSSFKAKLKTFLFSQYFHPN